ncbi:MAG: hypothetical protein EXS13_12300 [Planctomycetes bacterium]|nr:hypothetical protein [Planctomycetota bacterium]
MGIVSSKLPAALLLAFCAGRASAVPVMAAAPAALAGRDSDDRYVAIRCGKLITGTGEEKQNVTLLVKNGKVELIGEKVELPHPCEVIDASKMVVMPGHIHAHSRISLLDFQRPGMRADLKVADEFLPAPGAFDAALAAGFTTLQLIAPGQSGIPGRCMVVRTADFGDGYALDDDGAIKANLISAAQDRRVLSEALQGAKREIEKRDKAKAEFEAKKKAADEQKKKEEEAKKAAPGQPQGAPQGSPAPAPPPGGPKADEPPKPDAAKPEAAKPEETFQAPPIPPQLQPFVDLVEKKAGSSLFVKLGSATSYLHWLEASKDFEIAHVLYPEVSRAFGYPQAFSGVPGTDLHWIAKQVGENKELVVLAPWVSYAQASIDLVNVSTEFLEAGARVALTPPSDSPEMLSAFRFQVAELVKAGLKRNDAIAAITKNAADAIGVGTQLGTLEPGKEANLIVLTADPLDVQATLERVLIGGRVAWTRAPKSRS